LKKKNGGRKQKKEKRASVKILTQKKKGKEVGLAKVSLRGGEGGANHGKRADGNSKTPNRGTPGRAIICKQGGGIRTDRQQKTKEEKRALVLPRDVGLPKRCERVVTNQLKKKSEKKKLQKKVQRREKKGGQSRRQRELGGKTKGGGKVEKPRNKTEKEQRDKQKQREKRLRGGGKFIQKKQAAEKKNPTTKINGG